MTPEKAAEMTQLLRTHFTDAQLRAEDRKARWDRRLLHSDKIKLIKERSAQEFDEWVRFIRESGEPNV